MAREPLAVKLLLDEHPSPDIARQLREGGRDVVSVGARSDRVHFASLPDEERAIVTRDVADVRPLLAEALRTGATTYGLVCVPRRFSLAREGTGRLVRALEALLVDHPDADAAIARGGEIWLDDGPSGVSRARAAARDERP